MHSEILNWFGSNVVWSLINHSAFGLIYSEKKEERERDWKYAVICFELDRKERKKSCMQIVSIGNRSQADDDIPNNIQWHTASLEIDQS